MVAAQDHGDGAGLGDLRHGRFQAGQGGLGLARQHQDVADVDHAQFAQRVDIEGQMGTGAVVGEVVGRTDGLRPEAAAGAVRGAPVERCADDHHRGIGVAL